VLKERKEVVCFVMVNTDDSHSFGTLTFVFLILRARAVPPYAFLSQPPHPHDAYDFRIPDTKEIRTQTDIYTHIHTRLRVLTSFFGNTFGHLLIVIYLAISGRIN
jgi:hypothetical protein